MNQTAQTIRPSAIRAAEIIQPCEDFPATLSFFLRDLAFRLDEIYPADDPSTAVLSGHGMRLRLVREKRQSNQTLILRCANPEEFAGGKSTITAPNGTEIRIVDADPPLFMPPTQHSFVVRRLKDGEPWIIGRAGMQYRDLVPDRLGGTMIASHIRVPDAGPVPDNVHFHIVGFQMIYCYRGWVRLVYEDQGPPFVLAAGDCVLQPPRIRHRVLESSGGLEVIEIGCPAEHVTTLDHEMELPTDRLDPQKDFDGQVFCRHESAKAEWREWRLPGFKMRDTGIGAATDGVASVRVICPDGEPSPQWASSDADIYFAFVLEGSVDLEAEGRKRRTLEAGDAFVLPPGLSTRIGNCTPDFELLEVTLPANFKTQARV